MSRVHIEAELPATTDERERVEAYATVVDAGLKAVASDPEMRLQMILGEAHRRYRDLCLWLSDQLLIDSAKAPGVTEAAMRAMWEEPHAFMRRHLLPTPDDAMTRQRLLQEAVAELLNRGLAKSLPPPEIDGDGA